MHTGRLSDYQINLFPALQGSPVHTKYRYAVRQGEEVGEVEGGEEEWTSNNKSTEQLTRADRDIQYLTG